MGHRGIVCSTLQDTIRGNWVFHDKQIWQKSVRQTNSGKKSCLHLWTSNSNHHSFEVQPVWPSRHVLNGRFFKSIFFHAPLHFLYLGDFWNQWSVTAYNSLERFFIQHMSNGCWLLLEVQIPLEATFISSFIFPEFTCLTDFLSDLSIVKNSTRKH